MFLTDDYDRLSDLGKQQAELVGRSLAAEQLVPTHIFVGALQRQQQTLAGIQKYVGETVDVVQDPLLNEFPFEAMLQVQTERFRGRNRVVDAILEALQGDLERDERIREVQRLLEFSIDDWVQNDREDRAAGIPAWREFVAGVQRFLSSLQRQMPSGSTVLAVTSGGVIAALTQTVLEAPILSAARLGWRVNNASITQMTFTQKRVSLDGFNRIGHLTSDMRTYR